MGSGLGAWAGLGLFFVGMRLLGAHLQQLGGGRLRALLSRTLGRRFVPQLAGFASGALTQSTSAVTFIAAGLVSAGVVGVAGAIPLLAWANVGTSVLVLVASIDLHALVYVLLGATGLAFFWGLEQQEGFRHLVLALLGLGLLMLGLTLLKESVGLLRGNPWAEEFFEFAATGPVIAFLIGVVIATAVQSSSIVTVLALPLVHQGLLDLPSVTLLVYGASVGSGIAVLLLASGIEGPGRQLALCQAALRALAAALLLMLFWLETAAGVPLVMAGVSAVSSDPAAQCGLVYLVFQFVVALVAASGGGAVARLASRAAPPAASESLSRPAYLFEQGTADPETALALARLEFARLVGFLPDYLDELRPAEERSPTAVGLARRAAASEAIAAQVDAFLGATLAAHPDMAGIERLFVARHDVATLRATQDALVAFAREMGSVPEAERPALARHMVEGLHALLGVAADAVGDAHPDARADLQLLTADRGGLLDRVRRELLGGAQGLAGREALVSATLLFERLLWMLRQLAPVAATSATAPAAADAQA